MGTGAETHSFCVKLGRLPLSQSLIIYLGEGAVAGAFASFGLLEAFQATHASKLPSDHLAPSEPTDEHH